MHTQNLAPSHVTASSPCLSVSVRVRPCVRAVRVLPHPRPLSHPALFPFGATRTTPLIINFKSIFKILYRTPLYRTATIIRAHA